MTGPKGTYEQREPEGRSAGRMTEGERRDRILILIQKRPGIGFESLCIHLGYSILVKHKRGTSRGNDTVRDTLINLLEANEIWAENLNPKTRVGVGSVFYAAGYVKPRRSPPPNHEVAARLQCKTYRVPLDELHKYIPRRAS